MFFLGFGLTAWGKYLMPQGPFVEERHPLASSPEERGSMSAVLVERTTVVVKRRRLLGGLFAWVRASSGSLRCSAVALARPGAGEPFEVTDGTPARSWSTRTGDRCARTPW